MSESLIKQDVVWVQENYKLERLCENWREQPMLAMDTEFLRTNTYYPIAGLLQINDGQANYLIDPKSIDDFFPLVELLDDASVLKVLHSCSEDLEVFHRAFGCLPKNIFDTQIAAAIAGYGFSVGFANLVKSALNVELPKNETRSDWLQRPLSDAQIRYAAIDVEYLYHLTEHLLAKLRKKQRLQWALDDSAVLVENYFDNQNPDKVYLRVKSAWKLSPLQLEILKNLTRWREDLAQEKDLPRNRVVKESAIFDIAQQMPDHVSQLRNFDGINERMIRSFGSDIVDIVSRAKSLSAESLPQVLPRPLNSVERKFLAKLKSAVTEVAEKLEVPTEVLVRKKEYELMVRGVRDAELHVPESLLGWRKEIVGNLLADMVQDDIDSKKTALAAGSE